jgi:hypothetical protein
MDSGADGVLRTECEDRMCSLTIECVLFTGYAIWIAALTVFWLLMTDNLPHMWKMFTIVLYSK